MATAMAPLTYLQDKAGMARQLAIAAGIEVPKTGTAEDYYKAIDEAAASGKLDMENFRKAMSTQLFEQMSRLGKGGDVGVQETTGEATSQEQGMKQLQDLSQLTNDKIILLHEASVNMLRIAEIQSRTR